MMRILISGGAGFIGSNLVGTLLDREDVEYVRVVDNLSTGYMKNVDEFSSNKKFDLLIGDIRDIDICKKAVFSMDIVLHQAALGSVPRSMKTPLSSHDNNVVGFVNLLEAARLEGIKRFVYASSSSVYGNTKTLADLDYCKPVSFYGMTKHVNDLYAKFYTDYFNMECIGLRYHNVFGKRQSFKGEYSAVIPIFITTALRGDELSIHGDGTQYRDFTHVSNVVNANILSILTTNRDSFGKSFDIGSLTKISVNELSEIVLKHTQSKSNIKYIEKRKGDIHASFAHMPESKRYINYTPIKTFDDGILETVRYYSSLENL